MQLPDTAVRTALFSLLSAAGILCFDSEATVAASPPYVLLSNQDNTDFSTKSGYGWIHRITIKAVTVGQAGSGKEDAETLMNQTIAALTHAKPGGVKLMLAAPFHCWRLSVGPTKDLVFTGDTDSVFQKIITLELNIELRNATL